MKTAIKLLLVLGALLVLAACAGNRFIIYKDGKAYYFAGKQEGLYEMLCTSGDFRRVLENTKSISAQTRDDLYRYNCDGADAGKVQALYTAMTVEQRKDLREAFKGQGYEINYFPCG